MFLIGMSDNRGNQKVLYANDEESERNLIKGFFEYIDEIKPTIICGYNSAFFDWEWIITRAEILGLEINTIAKTLNPNVNMRRNTEFLVAKPPFFAV